MPLTTEAQMRRRVSANLKALRRAHGLTQAEAAHRIGIYRPALGSYEEKRSLPKVAVVQRICFGFGLTLEAFLTTKL